MEASGIVLDTDVMVSDLRGKTSVLKALEAKDLTTTVVNAFELFHGAHRSRESDANLSATRGLLASLRVLGLDLATAEEAGQVLAQAQKSGQTIEIRALLIGCIAREEGLPLLTYNVKHFRSIPGLVVQDARQQTDG